MKKNGNPKNDLRAATQNRRKYKSRRLLYFSAAGIFIINLLSLALLLPDVSKEALTITAFTVLVVFLQSLEKRKTHWDRVSVITWCSLFFLGGAVLIIKYAYYRYFIVWGTELLAFLLFTFCLFTEKNDR